MAKVDPRDPFSLDRPEDDDPAPATAGKTPPPPPGTDGAQADDAGKDTISDHGRRSSPGNNTAPGALTPRQEHAAVLLAGGHTPAEVARRLRTSKQTLTAWSKRESFIAAVNAARQEFLQDLKKDFVAAARRNARMLDTAWSVLERAMNGEPIDVGIRAANIVIQHLDRTSVLSTLRDVFPANDEIDNDEEGLSK